MSKQGRPRKGEGAVYQRDGSQFWQVWYRDRKGEIQREATGTTDRVEAERFLRDRLDARDEGRLSTVLISKQLTFGEWADWFLERRTVPERRKPSAEFKCNEISPSCVRGSCTRGQRGGEDRRLFGRAASVRSAGSYQASPRVERHAQAGDCSSGVPDPVAHAHCRGEANGRPH